jgi:site-specific DNA-methyltransferase (adenine-specific)
MVIEGNMIFPQDFYNKIICGDSLDVLKQMPDECVDIVLTSPPYNLNIRKTFGNTQKWKAKWNNSKLQSAGYDKHYDNMPEDKYIEWQRSILQECFRIIKNDGSIFYNHKWRVQKGLYQQRLEIIQGLPLRQIIIWKKAGGINFNDNYFLPTYEVIYLIAKPDFKLAPKANRFGDVWEVTQEKGSWHPAPFPIEIATRCVSSSLGTVVLDPFIGSGTVAVACKQQGKTYIGIDISQDYCDKAEDRLKAY